MTLNLNGSRLKQILQCAPTAINISHSFTIRPTINSQIQRQAGYNEAAFVFPSISLYSIEFY